MLNKWKLLFCLVSVTVFLPGNVLGRTKTYELRVQNASKNVTGVDVSHALAINGSIPAPTLRFRLGDLAVITVINETSEPTTLHWHGVLVPWRQDGPQFTNTKIIEPHSQHVFEFPIRHTGTYWYHSHTELQEQRGLYGAIVIEDGLTPNIDHDAVVVMSDWTNERPSEVLANLKRDGHYYRYKKGSPPSILDAIDRGELWDYLKNEWNRMEPMDLSDVGYDAFLINGEQTSVLNNVTHGEKIRLRLINAAASTYFYFNIGHLRDFTVISKDGMPVKPVVVNELLMGMGETYDIVFRVPHAMKTFEARATAQDITGSASLLFGGGEIEEVPEKQAPSPYSMENHQEHGFVGDSGGPVGGGHEGHGGHSGHGSHGMASRETKRLTYPMLESITPSEFDQNLIRAKVIDLELSGDMERYTWYINGKPFSEDKYIDIRENEVITFRFINTTMMHHPMHLHGHFFRLLAGQGDSAPLFHTVDVAPTSTVTIEFHANEPGIWFLHCHNLYHMKMGMARLVRYQNIERPPELVEDEQKWGAEMVSDDSPFWNREVDVYSNFAEAELVRNSGRLQAVIEIEVEEYDFDDFSRNLDNLELEAILRKYVDDLGLGAGAVYKHQRAYAVLAAVYNLPGNTELEGYVRHDGRVKLRFIKEIPISERFELRLEPKLKSVEDTELEDHARLHSGHNHGPRPFVDWSLKTEFYYNYNEKLSIGANYRRGNNHQNSAGIGFKIQF